MSQRSSITLATILALVGFLVMAATVSAGERRAREAPRRAELVELIRDRQALVDDLGQAVQQLREQVTEAQARRAARSSTQRRANEAAQVLALQAGTVGLQGPGLVVTLANSARTPPSPDQAGAYVIHDADVQLAVNALLAAGAEAVAVNDSRVVATTPIRSAGDTIVVNFRPLTAPYRIVAIGADRDEFAASGIAQRFREWTRLFGLGFDVTTQAEVTVPPYTGRVGITTATPASED